jgi:hypothetical protein
VIVRVAPTAAGQTWLLTVDRMSGPAVNELRRPYANPRTAEQAYTGICHLFAAGYTVDAVVDFAEQHAAQPVTEYDLTPCEVAA